MSYTERSAGEVARGREGNLSLVTAIAERSEPQKELYHKFRRPLLQVFQQRRIDPDAAQDLLQRTFLQVIQKIRADGLADPSNLGGYLYRTASNLAAKYWRGELAHEHDSDGDVMTNLIDDALPLEERIDHDTLARSVRNLIEELPAQRDREVLERFYLREESRASVCESLHLTSLQFNQVLWRARRRFGEILRKHGLSRGGGAAHSPKRS
ncbi:MAG TPA: sigma-70 family RNA polymerase sigma factor [Steroidobacteraceae bacterium]